MKAACEGDAARDPSSDSERRFVTGEAPKCNPLMLPDADEDADEECDADPPPPRELWCW